MQTWDIVEYNNVGYGERNTKAETQIANTIEWEYQKLLYDQHQQSQQQFQSQEQQNGHRTVKTGDTCVKVMTDEQVETLRKQIAVYGVVCEQLEQKVMKLAAQDLQAFRLGQLYGHSIMSSTASRLISRKRWQPTAEQVQILEGIFNKGTATPTRENVKEITAELKLHGEVKETNVYNWFQNRRARLKRKGKTQPNDKNAEQLQVDTTEIKSAMLNKRKSLDLQPQPRDESAKRHNAHCFQYSNGSSDMHFLGSHMNEEDPIAMLVSFGSLNSTLSYAPMPVWEGMFSNSN